jgi:Lactonase, 7-bladed beta-propeller
LVRFLPGRALLWSKCVEVCSDTKIGRLKMKKRVLYWFVGMLLSLSIGSPRSLLAQGGGSPTAKAVFVMTNSAEKNEVISFVRTEDGMLQEGRRFSTGGRGSGGLADPLESQGALTLSQDGQWLFAANAGSGEISVFRVNGAILALTKRTRAEASRLPLLSMAIWFMWRMPVEAATWLDSRSSMDGWSKLRIHSGF